MDSVFPFVRGEFLTKVSKFAYIHQTEEWIRRINSQLEELDMVKDHMLYDRLERQRGRLEENIANLQKSIEEDISASKGMS